MVLYHLTESFDWNIISFEENMVMVYNIKCPNCGTEQKHLNLEETEGSFICSKCNKQTRVDLEAIKKESLKKETAN